MSMPALRFSNSAAMWPGVPLPAKRSVEARTLPRRSDQLAQRPCRRVRMPQR